MNNWRIAKLGEVSELIKDGTHGTHKNVKDGPFLLSAQNVENGNIIMNENDRKISEKDFNLIHHNYKMQDNDVLITIVGTLGRCAILKNYHDEFTFQRSVAIVRFDEEKILPQFAYYQIRTDRFQKELKRRENKGAQGGVYLGELTKILMVVPDLETQQKIVQILDNNNKMISILQKRIIFEKHRFNALKYELLFKRTSNKEGVKLKKLFDFKNGYTPSKSNSTFWTNGTIPWFRIEDIRKNGRILNDSIQHVTTKAIKGKLFPKDSIIMSTTATIGDYAWLTADSLANQQFTFLIRKVNCSNKIDIEYFYHYCSILSGWCKRNVNSGGLLAVDMKAFMNYPIKLPTINEQINISKFLSMQGNLIDLYEKELLLLNQQYKYLLNHLINGDFDLSNIKLENGKE